MPDSALRVMIIARPSDGPAAEDQWRGLHDKLAPLVRAGQLESARGDRATESALRAALAADWNVIHLLAPSAGSHSHYCTVLLEGRDGRDRAVTVDYLGRMMTAAPSLRLVILQAPVATAEVHPQTAAALVEAGAPGAAVARAGLSGAGEFYAALATGEPLAVAARRSAGWIIAHAGGGDVPPPQVAPPPSMAARSPSSVDASARSGSGAAEARPILASTPIIPDDEMIDRFRVELAQKRSGSFDVFLCHNTTDKPAVRAIARHLLGREILPWLDEWELRPGLPWQRLLEEQIACIGSAAVFVGAEGVGPWQRQEIDTFLREFAVRSCPVIPVLLESAPAEPKLPSFLRNMTWVDFRIREPDPLKRLIWGITGRPP